MSQQDQNAAQLPNVDTAAATVFDRVDAAVFAEKLASHGIEWNTEEEFVEYLKLGNHLLQREQTQKAASSRNGLAFQVSAAHGLGKQAAAHQQVSEASQVAASLMQDPDLYDSTLTCKAAEAQLHADAVLERMQTQ